MKNSKFKGVASMALAVMLVGTAIVGNASAANQTQTTQKLQVECAGCVTVDEFSYDQYVKDGTITQAEADVAKKVYAQIDKLFENVDENTTEAEFKVIDEKVEKLLNSINEIEKKIFGSIGFGEVIEIEETLTPEEMADMENMFGEIAINIK